MTSPKFADTIPGKGRWYTHPETGEKWPSITNVLDMSIAKQHQLLGWAVKLTAERMLDLLPTLVASSLVKPCKPKRVADECGECRPCLVKTIKRAHKDAKDQAADLGDRIHTRAEHHMLDVDYLQDPEVEPFFQQLLRFLDDYNVDLERDLVASEATVVNRAIGYAGTGDLWLKIRVDGWKQRALCLIDFKTSSTKDALTAYPEQGMQLAALANGETLLLPNGTEVPAPGPIKATFVLALRADDYALIPMPMRGSIDDAFEAFKGALPNAKYLHSQYGAKPTRALPHTTTTTSQKAS